MVKTLEENSAYEPCIRSYRWLKLKRDYLEQSLCDSLDLVVIAAKYGEGKRTGFFGTFLLASFNNESERYETTGMCATGFSDEDLKTYSELLRPLVLREPHSDVFCKEGTGSRAVSLHLHRWTFGLLLRLSVKSWLQTFRSHQSTPAALVYATKEEALVLDFLVILKEETTRMLRTARQAASS